MRIKFWGDKMSIQTNILAGVVIGGLSAGTAFAQDLTFKFNNPSFGGNSFNSAHLLALAELQKQFDEPTRSRATVQGNDASAAFIRQLENRLLASIANDLVNQITEAEPGTGDTVTVGDQQISFTRTDTDLTVVITNLMTLASTEIVLPTLLLDE